MFESENQISYHTTAINDPAREHLARFRQLAISWHLLRSEVRQAADLYVPYYRGLISAMGRIVLLYLFQFARRVLQGFTAQSREESYTTYDDGEERLSKTAIAMIAGLGLYIAAGLGYYVKVHCWDELTEAQKGVVVQAMIANDQAL